MIQKFKEHKNGTFVRRHSTPKVGDILEVEFLDGTKSVLTAVGDTEYAPCECCDGNLSSPGVDRCIAIICNFPCPGLMKFRSIDTILENL